MVTVMGVFEDHNEAEQALHELKRAGFRNDQIGFVVRHRGGGEMRQDIGVAAGGIIAGLLGAADALLLPIIGPTDASSVLKTGVPMAESGIDRLRAAREVETEAEQGTGAPSGESTLAGTEGADTAHEQERRALDEGVDAAAGAVVGGFLGAAGALLIPGIGPLVAGGILLAALAGAGIGAMTGGIIGAYIGLGVPEHAAHQYEREFKAGRTIVTVKAMSRQQEAVDILHRNGAVEVQVH